jgi:hypothetical protein
MMWFRQRKPRRFEHRMIYADDRKKFLSELEQRAKGELGMSEKKTTAPDFHAAFTSETSHLHRKEKGQANSFIFMGIVLLALIAVILYLLNS